MRCVWNTNGACETPGASLSGKGDSKWGTETHPQAELLKAICSLQVHLENFSAAKIMLRTSQNRIMTIWEKRVMTLTMYINNNTIIPRGFLHREKNK